MDENEWQTCVSPQAMFRHFRTLGLSDRKLWLIFFNHDLLSLGFAPRNSSAEDSAEKRLMRGCEAGFLFADGLLDWRAVYSARHPDEDISDYESHRSAIDSVAGEFDCRDDAWVYGAAKVMCHMIRDIVGNPFRPVTLDGGRPVYSPVFGAGVTYDYLTPQVLSLATAAYEDRSCPSCLGTGKCHRYNVKRRHRLKDGDCPRCGGTARIAELRNDRLSILADALEDVGFSDEPTLRHLRGFTPHEIDPEYRPGLIEWRKQDAKHYRGCHAVDLILGKE